MSKTAIIILAAGASRRLGRPKQLLPWQGETLLMRTIQTALATPCRPVSVVLGAHAGIIQPSIEHSEIQIVLNPEWQQGMSTSLKIGLQTLLAANINLEAALLLVADQPLLSTAHLQQLLAQPLDTGGMVASFYNGKAGVPVLFHRRWFSALLNLSGDQGARTLLARHEAQVQTVPFPAGAFDIDTLEDYEKLMPDY
ncbi:MAG TPA: nucleotidyltransferase family protein [Saprospiraceae bacterium]|nr:nucleotidyltransferase family protein [Saprospiraceae bacterium]HMP22713.1 nucleotidyltransferase family protein [Saprospiraceae bacterium]